MRGIRALAVATLILTGAWVPQDASAEGIKRIDLQRNDLSVPGREVVQVLVEFGPGAVARRHSHPGEEIVFVVEGVLEYEPDGKPPVTLEAGEVRKDLRLKENRTGKRKVVVVMRERKGNTVTGVFESEAASLPTVQSRIENGSTVYADEASSWDGLHARFSTKRINHSVAFSDDGACTNMAESFFSRLRRAEIGTHHHISGQYLNAYASEMAWREDNRRIPNGGQFLKITAAVMAHPVSAQWKGYWQRSARA